MRAESALVKVPAEPSAVHWALVLSTTRSFIPLVFAASFTADSTSAIIRHGFIIYSKDQDLRGITSQWVGVLPGIQTTEARKEVLDFVHSLRYHRL
jgi:hypothetical protein